MKTVITANVERAIFAALVAVGAMGIGTKYYLTDAGAFDLAGFAAAPISDFMAFFGTVGAGGLLCMMVFGTARIDRAEFWAFVAGLIGAVILFS
jgi:hypothetical protein